MEEQKNKLKILVKFPTRERPEKFKDVIKRYDMMATDKENIKYLVSLDKDDPTLQQYIEVITQLNQNITAVIGDSTGKIHACNRDVKQIKDWDILLLASDDMICQRIGWDVTIRTEFEKKFPDTDGTLFFYDGDPATARHNGGKGLCTMCILGKKYYKRFNYIYHPDYISLWCDNEYTEVAQDMNKMRKYTMVLFKHAHFSNSINVKADTLMVKTQSYFETDKATYNKRKQKGFPIHTCLEK